MSVQFGTLQPNGEVTEKQEVSYASINNCSHMIFDPIHYRDDGTCKCDDSEETIMVEWGYTWDDELGRWRG
jgi:hypothetical protein